MENKITEERAMLMIMPYVKKLGTRFNTIEAKIVSLEENIYMYRLEQDYNQLKHAIIKFNLDFPSIHTFKRHLQKIQKEDDVRYILSLFTEIWELLYTHVFDAIPKDQDPIKMLNCALSKYNRKKDMITENAPEENSENIDEPKTDSEANTEAMNCSEYNFVEKELNRDNFSALYFRYYTLSNGTQKKMQPAYHEYLERLNSIFSIHCKKQFGFSIAKNFQPLPKVISVDLSLEQLEQVYNIVLKMELIETGKEVMNDFLAVFDKTSYAQKTRVKWLQTNSKNGEASFSLLYTLFESLRLKMTTSEKETICSYFVKGDGGNIKPNQLKLREESKMSKKLSNEIAKLFPKNVCQDTVDTPKQYRKYAAAKGEE